MIILLFALALFTFPVTHAPVDQSGGWRTYRGAWFEVKYPANFSIRPSQRSSSSTSGYDSVFFTAPDGSVEFYVFSPQWNGQPSDIQINSQSETVVSQETVQRSGKIIRRMTIKARDGSYLRSYEDTEDTITNTRKVFAIKYANTAAYNRYRQSYLIFKNSLTQFAD